MMLQASKNYVQPLLNALLLTAAMANVLLLLAVVLTKHYGMDIKDWEQIFDIGSTPQSTTNTSTKGINAMPLPQAVLEQDGLAPEAVSQNFSLAVPPRQSAEFKFSMARDYDMGYHWQTDGKALHAELRGQKHGSNSNEFKVFGKLKDSEGKGFFIAPFNGDYALLWQNKTDKPIIIRLTAKGVFKVLG